MNLAKRNTFIVQVDDADHVIGRVRRSHALVDPINFRVAHLLLFDPAGHLLIQKIADGNRHAGMWGSSVATYVRDGETYRKAVVRAAQSELGLELRSARPLGTTMMKDGQGQKFIGVFKARLQRHRSLTMNVDEIDGVEFVAVRELLAQIDVGTRKCTPTFLHVLDQVVRRTM